jgi:hypothetical protein
MIDIENPGADEASLKAALLAILEPEILHVQHTTAQNTSGGGLTSGSDLTRTLNTEVENSIAGASLATNQITLPAGTYRIDGHVPFYATQRSRAWLYNITDAAITLLGSSIYCSAGSAQLISLIRGKFTIAGTKVFELRQRVALTNASNGAGVESNFTGGEIYADIFITKV